MFSAGRAGAEAVETESVEAEAAESESEEMESVETETELVETETELVETEVVDADPVKVQAVETEVIDADPAKVQAVEMAPAPTKWFDWYGICTRKSDDTRPIESELAEMEPFFPSLIDYTVNIRL
jgi:hypothetical protein